MEVDAEIDRLLVARKMEIIGEMFTSFFFFLVGFVIAKETRLE